MEKTMRSEIKQNGFTLIELLVVIAVIGILASVVMASLNSARAKARDAQRIANVRQLQTALELYYSDNGAYPVPPTSRSDGLVSNCTPGEVGARFTDGFAAMMAPYISQLADDPKAGNPWPYCYFYGTIPYWPCPSAPGKGYTIIFVTEKAQYTIGEAYSVVGEEGNAKRYCVYP